MRLRTSLIPAMIAAAVFTAMPVAAQSIVSARSGAIHHIEGQASIDGKPLELKFAEFPNLGNGSVLETQRGRAEMLLTPGVIVRLGEDSAVRMVSNRLTDTRVEFLKGSVLVEAMEILKDNAITFFSNGATISLVKEGLYRFNSEPAELRVYKGKARVRKGDEVLTAKKNKVVELGDFLVAAKFDAKQGDSLYRWSSRRSGYLAMANLSAARSLNRWGMSWRTSGWRWNPYFGMFTYIPASGMFNSPFGYSFWSPRQVYMVYNPPQPSFGGGGGSGGLGLNPRYSPSHGYVITNGRSAAPVANTTGGTAAAAAPSPRSGGTSSPRGGSSGGRGR